MRIRNLCFTALALVWSAGLFAQEKFDPASVRSRDCGPPTYSCGFTAPDPERARSIPVVPAVRMRGLPSSVDLSSQMPPVSNQGQQNSCVAWATTYATRSYFEQKARQWGYDAPVKGGRGEHIFSPAYVYNQINGGRDQGSVMENAFDLLVRQGAAPWSVMPYTDKDYTTQPTAAQRSAASNYKLASYRRIPPGDIETIKAELAAGRPVVFGMGIDDNFYQLKNSVYDQKGGKTYGGHAMALVGYDDGKSSPRGHRGAFKIINSWGTGWGDKGYGWISYRQWTSEQPWALVGYPVDTPTQTQTTTTTTNPTPAPTPPQPVSEVTVPPPAQVNATKGTYTDKIVVSWAAVENAVVYAVARAAPDKEFEVLGYSQEPTYEDKAVQQSVAYRYIVVAAVSNENYSDPEKSPVAEGYTAKATPVVRPPEKVTGVSATVTRQGALPVVSLDWTAAANASSYQVARYNAAAGQWQTIATVTAVEFEDRNPPANTKAYYAVRGVSNTAGKWSDTAEVQLAGATTPPSTPSGLVVSDGVYKEKIEVTWDAVPGAARYFLFRYDYGAGTWAPPISSETNSYMDQDRAVASGKNFAYTVVAQNDAGSSGFAPPVIGKTNPNAARGVTLLAPKNVKGTITGTTVNLSWTAVPGAKEYSVFKAKKGGKPDFVASVSTTSYSGAFKEKPGELYFYTVRSKSEYGGESADSKGVALFVNQTRSIPRERALPDQGIDRYTGTWNGRYMEKGAKPHDVVLKFASKGLEVHGTILMDNNPVVFKGDYATGATYLMTDQVDMHLLDFGLLELTFKTPGKGEVTAVVEKDAEK
ncbi:MAG: hypothetical protein K1X70_03225 [Leptospirales bacterium]|nr:hypothetical protein [Leptospirales bacterium]